ncbi:unnamed protein product [Acanthoscelides obtectus]|uniref:Uncharacterized protein n=1 Tax=Acanthoscelides obtectus TaxID=200917 RepID=A0A9P0JMF3_ACAOB|nr:unnamed protein product [Acanthoscelides obtectus]CAK1634875.1 hypothetical protein AOBTE_LOCUS8936 [Acanthoscelides obtectus]
MPTFSNSVREEVIDVTLSTLNLAQDIRDWKVSLTPSLSDHRFILFKTDGEIPDKYARNPRHTRWESFRADIDSKLGAVPYRLGRGSDIEAAVESLSRDLTAAYEENCPLRKVQDMFSLEDSGGTQNDGEVIVYTVCGLGSNAPPKVHVKVEATLQAIRWCPRSVNSEIEGSTMTTNCQPVGQCPTNFWLFDG